MTKSIMPFNRKGHCYTCGANCKTDVHHVFQGSNRSAATKYGLLVDLCRVCHERAHRHPKEFEETHHLKTRAQCVAMNHYHWDISTWRELFRKDYRS